jgi:type IV secretory pathway TrbL component
VQLPEAVSRKKPSSHSKHTVPLHEMQPVPPIDEHATQEELMSFVTTANSGEHEMHRSGQHVSQFAPNNVSHVSHVRTNTSLLLLLFFLLLLLFFLLLLLFFLLLLLLLLLFLLSP